VCVIGCLAAIPAFALTLEEIQQAIKEHHGQWRAADNPIWDKYQRGEWKPPSETPPQLTGLEKHFQATGRKDLPATLDWRDHQGASWVTPVRDQENCGSCWAFATVGPIESAVAYANGWAYPSLDLSEQQLLSCSINLGCDLGGLTTLSFEYAQNTGLVDEDCFPYEADVVPCWNRCADWQERVTKINSWEIVGPGGLWTPPEDIMEALQVGPVAASLVIYEDFMSYDSGIYETMIGLPEAFHAVTIVGYNADERYWICKNSWSSYWGEDGYIRMRWGAAQIGLFTILPRYSLGDDDDDDNDNDNNNDNDDNDDNDNNNDNDYHPDDDDMDDDTSPNGADDDDNDDNNNDLNDDDTSPLGDDDDADDDDEALAGDDDDDDDDDNDSADACGC